MISMLTMVYLIYLWIEGRHVDTLRICGQRIRYRNAVVPVPENVKLLLYYYSS